MICKATTNELEKFHLAIRKVQGTLSGGCRALLTCPRAVYNTPRKYSYLLNKRDLILVIFHSKIAHF